MKFCAQCGSKRKLTDKFCGECGASLSENSSKVTARPLLFVSVLIGALFIGGLVIYCGQSLIGKPPTEQHQSGLSRPAQTTNPADANDKIKELRAELEINPKSIPNLKALSAELWNLLPNEGEPSQALVLEIIDTLGKILAIDSKDGESLLMMANITFNQKVFSKSSEYFERYLAITPDDLEARASYASTLTFVGKPAEALKQLDTVLAKNPKAFQPLAFKAITLGQMNKLDEARKVGAEAMLVAPNDEAKKRFQGFLDSLSGMRQGNTPQNQADNDESVTLRYLKQHQIVGPKLVRSEIKEKILSVYLENFPMEAMPPFAKEKFESALKEQLKNDSNIVVKLRLIDNANNKVLAEY